MLTKTSSLLGVLAGILLVLVLLARVGILPGRALLRRDFDPFRTRKIQAMGPRVPGWTRYVLAGALLLAGLAVGFLDIPLTLRLRRNGGGEVFWLVVSMVAVVLLPSSAGRKNTAGGASPRRE